MFLTDLCSYLLLSQLVAVLLIVRAVFRWVGGSAGTSLVHAPCRHCSDVTTSCPGLVANEITAV